MIKFPPPSLGTLLPNGRFTYKARSPAATPDADNVPVQRQPVAPTASASPKVDWDDVRAIEKRIADEKLAAQEKRLARSALRARPDVSLSDLELTTIQS